MCRESLPLVGGRLCLFTCTDATAAAARTIYITRCGKCLVERQSEFVAIEADDWTIAFIRRV